MCRIRQAKRESMTPPYRSDHCYCRDVLFELLGCVGVAYMAASIVGRLRARDSAAAEDSALPAAPELAALPPSDEGEERMLASLRIGDIVQYSGDDFLVEGALPMSPGRSDRPHQFYRLTDGGKESFLYQGADEPLWLSRAAIVVGENPPERVLHDGLQHPLLHAARVTTLKRASVGADYGVGETLEVCEYFSGTSRVIAIFSAGKVTQTFVGRRVPPQLFEILPGS